MKPTNEQIIAEAERRWDAEQGTPRQSVIGHAIEIVRENWTPPEPKPVDPDLLAYREWRAELYQDPALRKDVLAGKWDHPQSNAFRAGARMAREQDAKMTAEEKLLRAIFGPTGRPAKEPDQ